MTEAQHVADFVHRGVHEVGLAVDVADGEVEVGRIEFDVGVENLTGLCAVGGGGEGDNFGGRLIRVGPVSIAEDGEVVVVLGM